jgi:hypothetical protein
MSKIFVIGFNKCGTTSLHAFLKSGGLRSVHWRTPNKTVLAEVMFTNLSLRRPILDGINEFDAYSDMMYLSDKLHLEGNALFPIFDQEYPDARFILNTRDKSRWLNSRSKHGSRETGSLLKRACACYGLRAPQVQQIWGAQWDRHHSNVIEYFATQPKKLLVFNIESDPVEQLVSFLRDRVTLDPANWIWRNKTAGSPESDR